MGIFGWSLPPGVSNHDLDGGDGPCALCGVDVADCECPECPKCGEVGDDACLRKHGMVLTPNQRRLGWVAVVEMAAQAHADNEYAKEIEENRFF